MGFFMAMIMAFALVSAVEAAGVSSSDVNGSVLSAGPAYTDYIDSRDIPHKAGANELQTPDVMSSTW
jgi:hypothetical protein